MTKNSTPTMNDVARVAGVSSMTVSRAFKANSSVSETTRQRILDAADQLGYVLDSIAAGLSTRKTGFVAVIIPSINNANFALTISALNEHLSNSGLQVLLGYSDYDMEEEERIVKAFLRRRPEAIVVTGGVHTESCRRYLAASGVPVIETWDLPTSPINHAVGFSNARAGRIMAKHLVEQGYKKIGFIGGNVERDRRGADRRHGFEEEIRAQGLSTERFWESNEAIITMEAGRNAMSGLLEKFPDTQAVMCASDLSACGAMMACHRASLCVPEDIAIAGFGAYDISANCFPEITSIDVGAYDIGVETAKLILMELAGDSRKLANDGSTSDNSHCIEMPITLLPRLSTGE